MPGQQASKQWATAQRTLGISRRYYKGLVLSPCLYAVDGDEVKVVVVVAAVREQLLQKRHQLDGGVLVGPAARNESTRGFIRSKGARVHTIYSVHTQAPMTERLVACQLRAKEAHSSRW